jgi:hypothetical protein
MVSVALPQSLANCSKEFPTEEALRATDDKASPTLPNVGETVKKASLIALLAFASASPNPAAISDSCLGLLLFLKEFLVLLFLFLSAWTVQSHTPGAAFHIHHPHHLSFSFFFGVARHRHHLLS